MMKKLMIVIENSFNNYDHVKNYRFNFEFQS